MSDIITYDKNTGVEIATKDEIVTKLKEITTQAFGEDVVLEDTCPEGIVINGLATIIYNLAEQTQTMYNLIDITNAEGVILDTIGNLRNTYRKSNTASVIKVTFDKDINLTTLEQIKIKDESNLYYYSNSITTLKASEELELTCSTKGEITEPTSLTILNNSLLDYTATLTSFNNGTDTEQDIFFRNRIINSVSYNGQSVKENLITQLLLLNFAYQVKIYVNDTDTNLDTKLGSSITPAHILVMIRKNNETFDADSLCKTIHDYKGIGTICSDISGVTTKGIGDYTNITYYLVKENTSPKINITILKGDSYNTNTTTTIKSKVIEYVNSLEIGENILSGNIIKYLFQTSGTEYYAQAVTIDSKTEYINKDTYFNLSNSNITITEVD